MAEGLDQHFVKIWNISNTVEIGNLKELLECFGHVKKIGMYQDESNKRLCIAQFATLTEPQAVTSLSGTKVGDLEIQVRQVNFSEIQSLISNLREVNLVIQKNVNNQGKLLADNWRDSQVNRTIYVGNLSHHITEEHLRIFFKEQGPIKYIKMSGKHINSNYCFIEFLNPLSAQRAHSLNGSHFQGRPLRIGRVSNPVSIPGVKNDILNNPVKLKQAVLSARLALEAIARKKKQTHSSETVEELDRDSKKRRSSSGHRTKSRSKSRPNHRHRRRSSNRRHRSRSESRSRYRRRRRENSKNSHSSSRSVRSRKRQQKSSRSQSRGRRKRSRSSKDLDSLQSQPKLQMVYDGFNWHPVDSAQGKATKEGERIGAAGPKIGSSPGYILGKGFVGSIV